eukprot:m.113724 g.113724  ORF g.113724 m.113724 type:complete len:125 (+) comp17097_c0_seq1:421-795(+)
MCTALNTHLTCDEIEICECSILCNRYMRTPPRFSTTSMTELVPNSTNHSATEYTDSLLRNGVCNISSAAMNDDMSDSLSELVAKTVGAGMRALEAKGITAWDETKSFRFKVSVCFSIFSLYSIV